VTEHVSLAAALVAALSELTVVEKGRTANAGSYSYEYADIADVVKLTRPVLAAHGLVALTPVHDHGDGLACSVVLLHTSGERLDLGPFPFPQGRDAQATGSMVTYHRRYSLVAALGMATGDDDDGAAAKPRQRAVTISSAQAKTKLVEHLTGKVPDPVKDHAAAVWAEAGLSAPLSDADMARLLEVADEYVADLAAMAPEPVQESLT
jgi:hypothetical protein